VATGDTLAIFTADDVVFEGGVSWTASIDTRNDHHVIDFDPSDMEECHFWGWLPDHYGGGGLEFIVSWAASTATSGKGSHGISIERIQAGVDDLDTESFAGEAVTYQDCNATNGVTVHSSVTFASGSAMDNLAANEHYRVRYRRRSDLPSDTMAGDQELVSIIVKEWT
jgi:hypothetical protein